MKTLQVSKDIIPLAQFKSQASKVFRQLHDAQRPIVVTQNGQAAAVLITPEEFDRLQYHDRFMASVRKGLEDAEAGRVIEDDALGAMLDEEFPP